MTGLVPLCDGLAGADTGGVLEWSPAGGWSLPGTQINTGNDVAVSRDGEGVYIGGWNSRCIKKVRRGSAGEPKTLAVEELIEYGPDTFGAATTALQVGREIWVGTARDQGLARSRFPMTNRSGRLLALPIRIPARLNSFRLARIFGVPCSGTLYGVGPLQVVLERCAPSYRANLKHVGVGHRQSREMYEGYNQ